MTRAARTLIGCSNAATVTQACGWWVTLFGLIRNFELLTYPFHEGIGSLKSVFTKEYDFLVQYLIAARKSAGITQAELAHRLRRPQSFVSKYERSERRLDVVELVRIARIIGFDPRVVVKEIDFRLQARSRGKRAAK